MLRCGNETVKGFGSGNVSLWAGLMQIRQALLPGLRMAFLVLGTPSLVTGPGLSIPTSDLHQ